MQNSRFKTHVQDESTSPKKLRVTLFRAVLALTLLSLLIGNVVIAAQAVNNNSSIVWSANFKNGDSSEFNGSVIAEQPVGAVNSFSKQIVYEGVYSAYYYYVGRSNPQEMPIRSYPSQYLHSRPSKFYVELWVYIPSEVNGTKVRINPKWISFASLWLNDGGSRAGVKPITVDSDPTHTLDLNLNMLPMSKNEILPDHPIKWSFNKWFSIGIYGELHPGTANSKIIVYQDGQETITWVGDLGLSCDGLGQMHFGLYANERQGPIAIYNDAISVYKVL